MDIVGECDSIDKALSLSDRSPPDIIVIAIARTAAVSVPAIRQALQRWPLARIIVLSPLFNRAFAAEVFRAGAHGYVSTQCAFDELMEAARTVASGSIYLCSMIKQAILQELAHEQTDTIDSHMAAMTDREYTILQLFGEGRTSKEIAAALNLSSKTIDAGRRQLMDKLDVGSAAGLIKCAIALGLTTVNPWPARSQ